MLRRWMIRALFLLPLTLALAFWMASHVAGMNAAWSPFRATWVVGMVDGVIGVGRVMLPPPPPGFVHNVDRTATLDSWSMRGRWGFTVIWVADRRMVAVPLWLPTAVFAGVAWLAWRKTRQGKAAAAFPVESQERLPPAA